MPATYYTMCESITQMKATWSFFATSHGKSPCDGIGGTVKRKVMRASLQRTVNNQILTFSAVVDYCSTSIEGIKFFVIEKEVMKPIRAKLEERYALGGTVPGTRSAHYFELCGPAKIRAKCVADDKTFSINYSFKNCHNLLQDDVIQTLKPMDYVSCVYDNFWWVGLVKLVNVEEKDVTIKFMKPHAPATTFYWPARDDIVEVPFDKILVKLEPPTCTSRSGRHYTITKEEEKKNK